jgi:branched-subunit amino acid aminotransferase/4-amino-4-deoxychorismate lyase
VSDGLFETMLVVEGRVVQLEEHLQRMLRSAGALGMPCPREDTFRDVVARVAVDGAVRCVWMDGRLTATAMPIPEATLRRRRGAHVVTLPHSTRRESPEHKLTSYLAALPALREHLPPAADEGLFVDRRGRILEGMTTNVFAIDGTTLITAPVRAGILPGIVRAWVVEHAVTVIERVPTADELRAGSFLTSSLTPLAAIRTINGAQCAPPGGAFTKLRRLYRAL